ncbi:hypothetical protein [Vibrio ezurae]|uniref:MSHA biogenesis protein MshP n=1 Tax=Vibrio ezurae NBRC 102218 TaxID=1219080 RepID=U3CKF4_9VIBR|nr:hypothetical protein [Vibrio ezurae]GAD78698.1 hypothetical protein VEZ01S_05_00870 [Vibrio ezurae NBRC 102218]
MYRNNQASMNSQKGNVYIIAVFIIVVLGMLTLNLTRISWSNQDTLTREVLGKQASMLAQSANEWALTYLFPLDGDDDYTTLSTRCGTLGADAVNAATALVENSGVSCSAPTISCETSPSNIPADMDNIPEELKHLSISSRAICNDGNIFEVERQQTVWVRGVKDE